MAKIKIELNSEGVQEMLKSAEAQQMCREIAHKALSRLGEGYEVTDAIGKYRCNSQIEAVTEKAKRDNIEKNSILKAVGS